MTNQRVMHHNSPTRKPGRQRDGTPDLSPHSCALSSKPSQEWGGEEELEQTQGARAEAAGPGTTGEPGGSLGEVQVQQAWIPNHKGPGSQGTSSKPGGKAHEDGRDPDSWVQNAHRLKEGRW
ncbi:mCG146828 [Mus musculus]|uniref:Uncharacterized protein n=1 Tax=Mus musculus TaxID=10090 RepID=Q9D9Y6_MOUSE|nr:mCG146828 [Mus musculus]BAB24534.1 unnamed protein product [Mus musculus]